ncbi:MAG: nucleotide exchange factor GrpE [Prevotella sp.]|nr:nucleotide exchange factor GrpE [Prevotella sp.]
MDENEKKEIDEKEEELKDTQATEEQGEEGKAEEPEAEVAEEAEAKDPLKEAQEKIEELNDKYLRKVAEFENYRKRTVKEKAELILNGGERTITKILPVIDDMERAIENGKKTEDVETLREGMDLIYKKFMSILKGEGVERIDTEDKDFSTDYHEAIAMVPGMGDDKKGKVIDCVQTGYTLNGKVIRYAKVAVGQ